MKEENIVHHTYRSKPKALTESLFVTFITLYPWTNIKEELHKEGHTVRNIMNIKHKQTNKGPLITFLR